MRAIIIVLCITLTGCYGYVDPGADYNTRPCGASDYGPDDCQP